VCFPFHSFSGNCEAKLSKTSNFFRKRPRGYPGSACACVITTAREAADRNFKVVVSDAFTTLSEQLHHANRKCCTSLDWYERRRKSLRQRVRPSVLSNPLLDASTALILLDASAARG
jgi:hypothetical protein